MNTSMAKITEMSKSQKRDAIIKRLLKKSNPFFELFENNVLSEENMQELTKIFSIVSGYERKLQSNAFSVNITCRARSREKKQIASEMIKRYKSSSSYGLFEKRYFEKRLVFGSSILEKEKAISNMMLKTLKGIDSNSFERKNFYENNVDLKRLIQEIDSEKNNGRRIITSKIISCNDEIIKKRLIRLKEKAEFSIDLVDKTVFAIETGKQREYVPLKIMKKKRRKGKA